MNIRTVLTDREGIHWFCFGGENGALAWHPQKGSFTSFRPNQSCPDSLHGRTIQCALEDSEGQIWLGSFEKGVARFNKKTGRFQNFSIENGLKGDNIFQIIEQPKGHIWIHDVNGGLTEYNLQTGILTPIVLNERFDNQAARSQLISDQEGFLVLGYPNRIVRFQPLREIKIS